MTNPVQPTNRFAVIGGKGTAGMQEDAQGANPSRFTYVIADDHPPVTLAVSQMLTEVLGVSMARLSVVSSSEALIAVCADAAPSQRIIVLDLVMPGELKRAQLVKALVEVDQSLKILVYTADESAFLAQAVLAAGATGYVAKTSPAAELMDAIAAVGDNRRHIDKRIDLESIKAHPWSSLTDSERAVLVAFCRGAKAHDIVEATGRTYSTVTTHKYNGLNKLGLRDGNDLLAYIYENGLLHELDG